MNFKKLKHIQKKKKITYRRIAKQSDYTDVLRERGSYNAAMDSVNLNHLYTIDDYYALPQECRVELIDGKFYDMAAPGTRHQIIALEIYAALNFYIDAKGGTCIPFAAPTDVQLDCDDYTMVQPDVLVVCEIEKITEKCVKGAPDFVVEVLSKSTREKDQTMKLSKYEIAGVREYWLVDSFQERIFVYNLQREESFLTIYGMKDKVPVGIFGGELKIDFERISKKCNRVKD